MLARLANGARLSEPEAEETFGIIMAGEATPAQIAALLMAMRVRGESVAELAGAARAMRQRMVAVEAPADAMDVCGTGGDGAGTLNVSTAVTFVVAGAGVPVAKHGNRALSSQTGGADVLAALGIPIEVPFPQLPQILRAAGSVFLYAPRHHTALHHAAGPRQEIGTRTIFNLLGPLANPARVKRQLVGVFAPEWARPMAETLGRLGAERAWVVHGQGLDELTLAGENRVVELAPGGIRELALTPEEAGFTRVVAGAIRGSDAPTNAAALVGMLEGEPGPYRDTVLFNAGAALVVAERATNIREGVVKAAEAVRSGAALAALEALRRESERAVT